MSKKSVRVVFLSLFFALVLSLCAQAASLPPKGEISESYFYVFSGMVGSDYLQFPKGTKFSGFSTTNPNFKYRKENVNHPGGKFTALVIESKKAGKGTVKITAKLGTKSRRYTIKVVAMKWKNPFKTLAVGSKNYSSKLDKYEYVYFLKKPITGKVNVKPNPGFTIESIAVMNYEKGTEREVKNGQKITLKKGESLHVIYGSKQYGINGGNDYLVIQN